MKNIYISLGSNIGDRLSNLLTAARKMGEHSIDLVRSSPVFESLPWGDRNQPRYLNQVVEIDVDFNPRELLKELQTIEMEMGRKDHGWSKPRIIDLDIISYGTVVIDEPDLKIPHPYMAERNFVLVPLSVIAPEFVHPVTKLSIQDMIQRIDCNGIKVYCR